MRKTIAALISLFFHVSVAWAQTTPTQEEIARWKKKPPALETSPCKMITWILNEEQKLDSGSQRFRVMLGWWGVGFIEGAAYMIDLPGKDGLPGKENKAMKSVVDFGLSIDIVVAHLSSFCRTHPALTPMDGAQELLLKALK